MQKKQQKPKSCKDNLPCRKEISGKGMNEIESRQTDLERASGDADQPRGPVGTLTRGLLILDLLIDSPRPLTLAEIASGTNLDQSTTLRLLRNLEEARYVLRLGNQKEYSPSPKALRPLSHLHPLEQLRRDSQPVLIDVARRLNATVVMALFIGTVRMVLDIAQTTGSLSPYYRTWLERPLHCTGVGKALLLDLTSEQRKAALGKEPYAALTAHTITTFADLEADLALGKQRGFVIAAEEHQLGLTAISAPIYNWSSLPIGCLTVTDHAARLRARESEVAKELLSASQLLPYQTTSLLSIDQFFGR
jgi:DNA-binding IclR family transcriptional regulator